jgi:dihydrofolate reductase
MAKLIVFNQISVDGYIADSHGDMSWAKSPEDAEWNAFVAGNASGGGTLLFGRVTYDLMRSYWPTPLAAQQMPAVAERMNNRAKVVFSRTLDKPSWNNTTVMKGDLAAAVRQMKNDSAAGLAILGSASIVSQLAQERLIDEYQMAVIPIALGAGKSPGKTMFEGMSDRLPLRLTKSRSFRNGNVFLCYEPST